MTRILTNSPTRSTLPRPPHAPQGRGSGSRRDRCYHERKPGGLRRAFGQTGTPTRSTAPVPWDHCPAAATRTLIWNLAKKGPPTFGPAGFPAFAGTMAVERVATGFRWAEGPVYFAAGRYLLFSDIPNNRIMRFSEDDGHTSVYRQPSMNSNGNTIDREGRLITGEQAVGADADRTRRLDHQHRRQIRRQGTELAEMRQGISSGATSPPTGSFATSTTTATSPSSSTSRRTKPTATRSTPRDASSVPSAPASSATSTTVR